MAREFTKEYALNRLDKWYSDRIVERYTPEAADKIIRGILDELSDCPDSDYVSLESARSVVRETLSSSFVIEKSRNYLSMVYSGIERLREGLSASFEKDTFNLKDFPGRDREMILRYFEHANLLGDFVNAVRKKSVEVSPSEVSDSEIDFLFLNIFGGCEKFSEMTSSGMNEVPDFLEGSSSREGVRFFLDTLNSASREICKLVFRDLEDRIAED